MLLKADPEGPTFIFCAALRHSPQFILNSFSMPLQHTVPEEVFLVDGVQHHDGSALDDLVFQGGDRQRPLPSVRLRYVRPAGRLVPVCSPVDPSVRIFEPWLKLCLVVLPLHAVHAWGASSL